MQPFRVVYWECITYTVISSLARNSSCNSTHIHIMTTSPQHGIQVATEIGIHHLFIISINSARQMMPGRLSIPIRSAIGQLLITPTPNHPPSYPWTTKDFLVPSAPLFPLQRRDHYGFNGLHCTAQRRHIWRRTDWRLLLLLPPSPLCFINRSDPHWTLHSTPPTHCL